MAHPETSVTQPVQCRPRFWREYVTACTGWNRSTNRRASPGSLGMVAVNHSSSPTTKHVRGSGLGQGVTIRYDEALCGKIRNHLIGHDRRIVTDPTKRHAAVAVVLVDSQLGEDRVDPAPVDDWIAGRPMPGQVLTAEWSTCQVAQQSCCAAERLASTPTRRSGASGRPPRPGRDRRRGGAARIARGGRRRLTDSAVLGLLDDYPTRSGYVITPVVIWGGWTA